MRIFKNIKFRILTGLFLFLFIIFYSFGYLLIDSFKQSYQQSIENSLTTVIKDLTHKSYFYIEDSGKFEEIKHEFDIDILYAQVIVIENGKYSIAQKSNDLQSYNLNFKSINLSKLSFENIAFSVENIPKLTLKQIKVASILLEQTPNSTIILQCGIPFNLKNSFIENMKVFLWIGLLTLLFIILIAVYFIISKSLKATKLVVDEVKKIKLDGKEHQVQTTGIAKEIDELIRTFNMLIDDLQKNYAKVKDFGQNASHELKTPLTIIRGEIEVALRKNRTPDEYKDVLDSIISELNFLQETIEKILFLSSNSDHYIISTFEEVYIDEILSESITEKKAFSQTKNVIINILSMDPCSKIGNSALLKIAINNLLDNAIKYSNQDSIINISLKENLIIVEDFGCGIPKNELTKIFDRFYRVDKVRSNKNGSGLGLSIVKTIIDLHNFKIQIDSVENKFTKVIISF